MPLMNNEEHQMQEKPAHLGEEWKEDLLYLQVRYHHIIICTPHRPHTERPLYLVKFN
jgi:hypothetical protein